MLFGKSLVIFTLIIAIAHSIEVDTGKIKKAKKKYNLNPHKNVELEDLDVTDTELPSDKKNIPKCKNTKDVNTVKLDKENYKYYTYPEDTTTSSPCVQESPEDDDQDVDNVDTQVEIFNPNSPPKSDVKNTSVYKSIKQKSRPNHNVFYNIFPGQSQTVYQPIISPLNVPASPLIFIIFGATNNANQPLDIINQILTNIRTPNGINYNNQIPQNHDNYIRLPRNLITDFNVNNHFNTLNKNIMPIDSIYRYLN